MGDAITTEQRIECPRCAARTEILCTQPPFYCIRCGAPIDISPAVPGAEPASEGGTPPRQLAIVERKYSTIRHAFVVEAGVIVIIAGSLMGLEFLAKAAVGGLEWLLATALALGPIPVLLAIGVWLDRFEPEPVWLLARTFLWGAAVAIVVAGVLNEVVGLTLGGFVQVVVGAPLIEEAMKGLAVL